MQVCTFSAYRKGVGKLKTKGYTEKIASVKEEGCREHDTKFFDRKPLVVPPCPPTNLSDGCKIISIEYQVQVSVMLDVVGGGGTPSHTGKYYTGGGWKGSILYILVGVNLSLEGKSFVQVKCYTHSG